MNGRLLELSWRCKMLGVPVSLTYAYRRKPPAVVCWAEANFERREKIHLLNYVYELDEYLG